MNQTQNKNSMLANGTMLQTGKYRVEECLASGGFGNTYIITNVAFGKRYALKEFFIKGVSERLEDTKTISVPIVDNQTLFSSQKDKFKREALFLSELNNEHIVRVQDFFEENGTAYYVMDYIDGESLSAYMKRTKQPMAEAEVMNILRQLLDALRQAHNKNILHLDIKPANVLITKEGRVVLIDFGASKQVDPMGGHTFTTTSLAYTPGYAPTEQIEQNTKRIGVWTDIFSLGATMYNLLSNERPPLCADLVEEDTFQLPSSVSPRMQQLVRWMMQPATKKRPQSVNDVTDWLHKQNVTEEVEIVKPQNAVEEEKTEVFRKQPVPKPVNPDSQPLRQKQPVVDKTEPKTSNKLVMGIISAAVVAAVIVLVAVLGGKKSGEDTTTSAAQTEIVAPADASAVEQVTDKPMTLGLGECTYTGEVDSNGKPHGQGEATFKDGKYYKGPFEHGVMHGKNAYYKFDNKDVFEGEFYNDKFLTGRITFASDGSYFIGTFADGQPDKGEWYSKNGKKL